MHHARHRITRRQRPAKLPLALAICFAISAPAFADETQAEQDTSGAAQDQAAAKKDKATTIGTVTVTAQKREENLQKVPISIQAIGNAQLEQQNVADFDDYAKMIPSLSYGTAGGGVFSGPGFVQVYMRGVASGGDGNHSGSQPSVGMYLDEQPITTIQGALDIHMYDIERLEALAGPQGTLYGASSQAGTVRIITRKPDPSARSSGYSIEANSIDGGGVGHVAEGFLNLPINDKVAIRLVGWEKHEAGYVDNVFGRRTFPTSGITIDNGDRIEQDYNDSNTYGVRAALGINFNENWTVTPSIIAQHMGAHGSTGFDPGVGDLAVTHFYPEQSNDNFTQAALTVQGKIGNFDLTYAFSRLNRTVDSESDYNDYGFWYDTLAGYGAYFYDDDGDLINPAQYIQARDGYSKTSHELRIASPKDNKFRFVGGVFWQEQGHEIQQRYRVDGLASSLEVPGWEDTIWLTAQRRKDHDEAIFGELSYDFTDKLTATVGLRFFRVSNSLKGFFGYGAGFSGSTGEAACFSNEQLYGGPCVNIDKEVDESDHVGRFNLTYQLDDNKLIYFTWSEGFRPGGINRKGTLPPYTSDFLTNYELGWKTTWADNRLSFNGAVFQENWDDFQFSYLGQNGLTEIRNAAQARIRGLETEINWAATYNLMISGGMAWYDAKLTADYCAATSPSGVLDPDCYLPVSPYDRAFSGTRLPVTARFKGNLNARYTFDFAGGEAYWQVAVSHQGSRTTDLRETQSALLGELDAYTLTDLSAGLRRDSWSLDFYIKNVFDERAELARFAQCAALTCGYQPYTVVAQPRTFGIRFSQEF